MKKYLDKIIIIVIVLVFGFTSFALAQTTPAPAAGDSGINDLIKGQLEGAGSLEDIGLPSETENPTEPVIWIIQMVLGVLALVFLVLVIYAGLRWMTSGGNQETIDKAKKIITAALIGLVIIFLSYSITIFVFNVVLKS
jgi:hypothetical protein